MSLKSGANASSHSSAGEILLIAADWPMRALVRAQLLEEGYEVQAWPLLEAALADLLRGSPPPQATVVDLEGMATHVQALSDLWQLTGQAPLLLCGGIVSRGVLAQPGLPPAQVLLRPFSVAEVVAWVRRMMEGR